MTADSAPSPLTNTDWQAPLAALLLVGVTVAAMHRVTSHPFSWWDDQVTIHQNPMYNPPSGEKIRSVWTAPQAGLYVPLTYTYWGALAHAAEMKDADAYGIHLDARVYHTASLILHLATALVVFSILNLLCRSVLAALAGALLFALHPVQVETVAWASGAKDLLCGLLGLCAVYMYLLHARSNARRRWVYFAGSALMLLLAMLAKPSAMVIPLITIAIDRLILQRPWRPALRDSGILLALTIPLAIIARIVQVAPEGVGATWWQRPLVAGDALAFYLYKLIVPIGMGPDYGRRPAVLLEMGNGYWMYVAWLIPLALTILVWRWRKRLPWLAVSWIVFVVGVLPVLGFTPFMFQYMSSVADHYLYLSMLGPALALAWALKRGVELAAMPRRIFTGAATAAALALLALRSADQLTIWQSEESLWSHNLAVSKNSFVGPMNLAAHLGRQSRILAERADALRERGRLEEAQQALAQRRKKLERAVELLETAVAIKPTYSTAHHNAYLNYMRLGRPEKALQHLEALLAINEKAPADVQSTLLGHRNAAGEICMTLGRFDQAVEHFSLLMKGMPENDVARKRLELARARQAEVRVDPMR